MLYLLTGEIQTGKTRWLEARVAALAARGVPVAGVIAPGVWRDRGADVPAGERYEKLGIDNALLPGGERVHLARRRDLAMAAGELEVQGQSERAGLGWAMRDEALAQVNAHLAALAARADEEGAGPGLFVVDELGRLELLHGEGLTAAVALLQRGPTAAYPDAIAVVRSDFLPRAHELFDGPWDGAVRELRLGDEKNSA